MMTLPSVLAGSAVVSLPVVSAVSVVVLSVVVVSLAVSAEPLQATREKTMISASRRAIIFFIF
ncbi:MAG: hypothetical protein MSB07_04550 [Mitsuokella jalaludinii]|nr:hypothetical protein [Mitsuokella jalaludinii]